MRQTIKQTTKLTVVSHWELVELADRLMSEVSDEHFLPTYDAALAADNDAPLVNFCARLQRLVLRRSRLEVREAKAEAGLNKRSRSSHAALPLHAQEHAEGNVAQLCFGLS